MRFLPASTLVVAVLAATGCATLRHGTTQRITVDSTPPGAEVFLDRRPVGTTPTRVVVNRGDGDQEFRLAKDGFRSDAQPLRRRVDWSVLPWDIVAGYGTMVLTFALLPDREGSLPDSDATALFAAALAPSIVDYWTGAMFRFPARVDAVLAPVAAQRMERPEMELPERWRADLRRALARGAAPAVVRSEPRLPRCRTTRDAFPGR